MSKFELPFDDVTLTAQVNILPNQYGMMNALNLFPSESISTTVVAIERVNGEFRVLPSKPRGAAGTIAKSEKGKVFYLEVPHFPLIDTIGPADVQNKTVVVDGKRVPLDVETATARKLLRIRRSHAITREYLRFAALKGLVKDGDGKTIVDLYTFFDVVRPQVDLALGTAGTEVMDKVEDIAKAVSDGVVGDTMDGVEVVIGSTLFNRLLRHPKLDKYYLNTPGAQALAEQRRHALGQDFGRVIQLGSVLFRESKAKVAVKAGPEALLDPVKGYAYPTGVMDGGVTYDAPPHHIDHVNQPGEEVFISTKILDHGAGVEFASQSNALPIIKRVESVVEITSSN